MQRPFDTFFYGRNIANKPEERTGVESNGLDLRFTALPSKDSLDLQEGFFRINRTA